MLEKNENKEKKRPCMVLYINFINSWNFQFYFKWLLEIHAISCLIILLALWLDVGSHVTSFNQLECIISTWYSYAMQKHFLMG